MLDQVLTLNQSEADEFLLVIECRLHKDPSSDLGIDYMQEASGPLGTDTQLQHVEEVTLIDLDADLIEEVPEDGQILGDDH